jgi:FAD/FMN-containing dehydrogenase
VGAGATKNAMDAVLQPSGWELRMHPSTKRTATIGGFVAGGSGGIGSVNYGGLRESGNILAARIVTMEEQPRVIELRGDAAQKINRAYGTTGIITALEMPLAPAWTWIDVVVVFDDFLEAAAVGYEAALADGIVKKLLSPITAPLPSYFGALKSHCPDGKSILIAMIAEPSLEAFKSLLGGRGTITLETPTDDGPGQVPLYEYTWNHTTLQVLKADRSVTYLQCLYPHDRLMEKVAQMQAMFPDEVLQHLEFIRFNGRVTCSALPVVRYRDADRLNEIIRLHEENEVYIANPHVFTVEDGSRYKRVDVDQLGFKHEVDPYGLLNPGKMRSFVPAAAG